MQFARKAVARLATFFMPLLLLATATTASVVLTLHSPTKIKDWVHKSGAYDQVVDAVLTQSQQAAQKNGDSLPVQEPQIQTAAKTAFSPQVLQRDTENVIDGTYHWLQGRTPQPDFKIDLSGPKQQFANSFGDYLRQRAKSLPVCARGQVPSSDDLATIDCLPKGFDINAEVQANVDKLGSSKDFLGEPVITANTLKSNGNQSPFDKAKALPKVYQRASWSPWLAGLLATGCACLIVFLQDRRRGTKRVAHILLSSGMLTIFIGIAIWQIAKHIADLVHLNGAGADKLRPAVISLINSVSGSFSRVYIWFGAVYVLLSIALLLTLKFWLRPAPEAVAESGNKKPVPNKTA